MPVFENVYKHAEAMPVSRPSRAGESARVTVSAAGWTLGHFASWLSREHGVSVVLESGLESESIVADFVDVPLDQVMQSIAKRLGVGVRLSGAVYFVGQLDRGDRGVLVLRARRLGGEDLQSVIESMLSESGSASVFADGLVVVSDLEGVLLRVSQTIASVETQEVPGWVVQVHVVGYSEIASRDLGVDVLPSARLAAGLASTDPKDWLDVSAEVELALRYVRERSDVVSVADPMLFLADGDESSFKRIRRVPYVSELSQTDGAFQSRRQAVEFLDVGFDLRATIRETSPDEAVVNLDIEHGTIVGQGGELPPTVAKDVFSSRIPVKAGGVYLVGSYETMEFSRASGVSWNAGNEDRRTYQIWLRAYRVAGAVDDERVAGPLEDPPAMEFEPLPDMDVGSKDDTQ